MEIPDVSSAFTMVNWTGIVDGLGAAVKIIAAVAIIGVAVWFVMRNLKFKHQVVLYEKLGKGFKMTFDRGRFLSTKNGKFFQLLKEKAMLPVGIVSMDYFFPIKKGFLKTAIAMYKFGPESYAPIEVKPTERKLSITQKLGKVLFPESKVCTPGPNGEMQYSPIPSEINTKGVELRPIEQKKNLFMQSIADQDAKEKKGSFWAQHGQNLILFGCLGMFIMLLIFGADTINGLVGTADSAVKASSDLMVQLAQAVEQLNACQVKPA